MRSTVIALLTATGHALAYSSKTNPYVAPGPGDVRSPCPGLNALANHGFLPHNGKGMTQAVLQKGLSKGLNMGADFTAAIGGAALLSSPNPLAGSFDLNDLDEHNFPIEHDSSLSRQDVYFGNDYTFYQPNFNTVLSFFRGQADTSLQTAANAKFARYNDSLTRNPTFTYGIREFVLSWGETALYLQGMSDPYSGVARVDFVKYLFENESLPYDLGWRPSAQPITLMTLGQMVLELFADSPEKLPQGLYLTANSYKDVLELIGAGQRIITNLTSI